MIPVITKMEVFPVAGHDSMLLNLSGAHAPYFTRNIVILTDSEGNTGVGEVPGGPKITKALEKVAELVVGTKASDYRNTLLTVKAELDKSSLSGMVKRVAIGVGIAAIVLLLIFCITRFIGYRSYQRRKQLRRQRPRRRRNYRR